MSSVDRLRPDGLHEPQTKADRDGELRRVVDEPADAGIDSETFLRPVGHARQTFSALHDASVMPFDGTGAFVAQQVARPIPKMKKPRGEIHGAS